MPRSLAPGARASRQRGEGSIHLVAVVARKLGGSLGVFLALRSDVGADLPQGKAYGRPRRSPGLPSPPFHA